MSKELLEAKDAVEAVELQSYTLKVQSKEEKPSVSNSDEEMKQQLLRSTTTDIPEIVVQQSDDKPPEAVSVTIEKTSETNNKNLLSKSHDEHMNCDDDVFIELLEVDSNGLFWKERARWIKFEENVEPSGNWGRPFLPYIECESLRLLRHNIENGLILFGSINDGAYNVSHTITNALILGGFAEPRYRARLQRILFLPRMHQGESASRFHKKVQIRRKYITMAEHRRQETMVRAWELSDNEIRNRWVRLARNALHQYRKQNPNAEKIKEEHEHREKCPEKYLFNEYGVLQVSGHSNHLPSPAKHDTSSVASDQFSDVSYLANLDFDTIEERGLPMTKDQVKLKKILHPSCKGVLILHAAIDFLKRDKTLSAFVHFKNDKSLVDSLEINMPIQFIYILFTSKHTIHVDGFQLCRAAAVLFKDKSFRQCALQAKSVADITKACFMFIDGSVMLPPGEWQPELLTPVAKSISEITRKKDLLRKLKHRDGKNLWKIVRTKIRVISMMKAHTKGLNNSVAVETKETHHEVVSPPSYFPRRGDCPMRTRFCKLRKRLTNKLSPDNDEKIDNADNSFSSGDDSTEIHPLQPDGRWFGGIRREFVKRYPLYWSDIRDGFNIQCLASLIYLSISLVAMCLTYGQVIAKYTKSYMGASEMLRATSISCIAMAVIGTEPLSVIAGTTAMLIFESSTYQASDSMGFDYFQFRWMIGMWIFIFLFLILAFDKTHWIHYCTRFTEEILHVLVALLFMYEGIKNIQKIYQKHPVRKEYVFVDSGIHNSSNSSNSTGTMHNINRPNTALLYTIIMFATFGIAMGFRLFEKTRFFSPRIRRLMNYFSIPVAVNVMNAMTYSVDVYLNTIHIPERLQLTSEKRGFYVLPDVDKMSKGSLSYWVIPLAAIPALLTVILLFIESEITLLECYKETRGRKGSGFHVNLLVVAIMVLVSSFLGLPWMCLAAVETSVHLDSLKVWSSFDAPGVKSHVMQIIEQRLTLLLTGFLVGLSAFLSSYLNHIPEAVFSGMVLYMGIVALFGVQMVERFFLMFMAPGQHPDIPYLKNVPLFKVHLFTVIQVVCVVVLWIVKSQKIISPVFTLFVLLMIPLRVLLAKLFTAEHIEQLDNEEEEEGHGPLD